jgi:hypothetical protein
MQVDNMNTVTLGIDVGSHGWVPLTLQVAEVTTGLEQLIKICSCHFCLNLFKLFTFFLILLSRISQMVVG